MVDGINNIPAIGFHKPIDVYFGEKTFVNTYALVLTLKIQPDKCSGNSKIPKGQTEIVKSTWPTK